MDKLYTKLYNLYLKALLNLNIGYGMQSSDQMIDIINAIDLIKNGNLKDSEILRIFSYYE